MTLKKDDEELARELEEDPTGDRGTPPDSVERVEDEAWQNAENAARGISHGEEHEGSR